MSAIGARGRSGRLCTTLPRGAKGGVRLRGARPHRGGFTLVEALLAGVILAIAGAGVGYGMAQAMQAARVAREYEQAAMLLDDVLTRVDLIGPTRMLSVGPNQGVFDEPWEAYRWEMAIESGELTDLYEVQVIVRWGQRRVEGRTRLYDPPGARGGQLTWEAF